MLIKYFDTLYKRESTYTLADDADIEFECGRVCFSWLGTRKAIEVEYVISISRL